ncbi:MAG: hypothetical protein QXP80_05480 [Zestosphaera sp.]
MLRDLLKSELSDLKLAKLSKEVVEGVVREITSFIDWCSSNLLIDVCLKEVGIISDVAEKLANVRLGKVIEQDPASIELANVDGGLLGKVLTMVRKYVRLALTGLVDAEDYVPVVVTSDALTLNNHHFTKGSVTTLKCDLALLIEAAGLVRVVEPSTTHLRS